MIQTSELVNAGFNTAGQGIESFRDGVQVLDFTEFVDEALSWKGAIEGLKEGFPSEARVATTEDVENLFEPGRARLLQAGLHPMLTGAIVSSLKSVYYTYAAIVQNPNEQVVQPKEGL